MSAPSSSNASRDSLLSHLTKLEFEQKICKAKTEEPELSNLQTVKKHYTQSVDYRTYKFANLSPKCEDTLSTYIAKLVKKAKYYKKENFFDPRDLIPTVSFLVAFKLASDTNNIHAETAMWVLPHIANDTLANTLDIRMYAKDR